MRYPLGLLAAAAALALAAPAGAELNKGYEAWNRGDYATAVKEWRDLAARGDPDAQFNMAQAYRQGKGVPKDEARAEDLLAKAAAQGHVKATDSYAQLLFQSGRREQAMPYVIAAADRGAPWAQYLLGISHFNGDLVEKDWTRAYALMTLSNAAGYPHAAGALKQMDDFIPLEQRQQAQVVAQELKRQADVRLASQLASEDLAVANAAPAPPQQASAADVGPLPSSASRIPQPIPRAEVAPSIAAAQAAVAEAMRVTGTESPGDAGADFARPAVAAPPPTRVAAASPPPPPPPSSSPRPASSPPPRQLSPAPAASEATGPWRIQLGAFTVHANADKLWSRLSGTAALAGRQKLVIPAGNLVKLQAGGYASRTDAQAACNTLQRGGQGCIVTR